ncbi:MAG: PDZ domain-containing protein [Chitinophagia bacterium]|jgi:serine protease Do|nr:PDZ domain-containing protein [Chitinophagia bacterium]NDD15507.1 PDZ domain-containing protein [Chitinophagia bacterium]
MKKILVSLLLVSFTFHLAMAQSNEVIVTRKNPKENAPAVIIGKDGKTPLYIVDGKIVTNINDIAPNDIESVSVFKGEMATKKYGEKALNGVVEITSKKNAKKEGTKEATKDSTKVTVTIDGNKNAKVKTDIDVNMTVVVDGNKVTINGKEVDENDPRLQIEGKNNKRIILKKLDKNLKGLANIDTEQPKIIEDNKDEEDNFDMIVPNQVKSNQAFLGVVTEETEEGAKINQVSEESPAAKAGLKEGDIITKVNDIKIDGPASLYDAIGKYKPEDKVTISYIRSGKTNTLVASLAKNKNTMQYYNFSSPEGQGAPGYDMSPRQYFDPNTRKLQPSPRGFSFAIPNFPGREGMTIPGFENKPKLGISIEDTETGDGVKITNVAENSPAAKSGLLENDIIVKVNDEKIKDVDALKPLIKDAKEGTSFTFQIKRNKELKTILVKLPKKLKTADL